MYLLVHPVTIFEIDKVLPKAYHGSFNPNRKPIPFKSTISVKLNTKAKWFDLPHPDENIEDELDEIAKKVYKERFSEESFDQFSKAYFDSDSDDGDVSVKRGLVGDVEVVDSVESVTAKFQDIIVPDDWEDLDSDSD